MKKGLQEALKLNNDIGFYITIEGPEATGKSTQAKALCKMLKARFPNKKVLLTKEPGSQHNEVCKEIRSVFLNPEYDVSDKCALLLLLADRSQHMKTVVKPVLKNNGIVISDRSSISTIVYHIAKLLVGTSENISHDYFYEMLDFAQEVQPDLSLITQADYEWSKAQLSERRKLDRVESFGDDFHKNIHALFKEIATSHVPRMHPLLMRMRPSMQTFPRRIQMLSKTNLATKKQLSQEAYRHILFCMGLLP